MAALPAPPAAGPQLDWGAIGGAFNILAQQVPMIPGALNQIPDNAAFQAMAGAIVDIQNVVTGIQNGVTGVQNTVAGIQNTIADIQNTIADTQNTVGDIQNTIADTQNTVGDIQNTIADIQNTVGNIQNTVDNIENAVGDLEDEVALQPMRMANASASNNAPLVYPPGTAEDVLAQLPRSKFNALTITGVGAQHALVLLGIQPMPGANAEQVRSQFRRLLGV